MRKNAHNLWSLLWVCFALHVQSQELPPQKSMTTSKFIDGAVYGIETLQNEPDTLALRGVNVFWQNSTIGTTTNADGLFSLKLPDDQCCLIFSYIGYENDTLHVHSDENNLRVFLQTVRSTEEISVSASKPHTIRSADVIRNSETLTTHALQQLACCNLAESFETTASVDVEQSDAVSGARRIKMLGLAGFYTQMMIEKKPVMRGLVNPFSLEYVPGFWMESIDISKGTASVATGYESITGEINIELKKPENSDPVSANGYVNSMGKTDIAVLGAHQFNPKLSTMVLTFGTSLQKRWDTDNDTFIDMPLLQQFNLMNRWKYAGERVRAQFGIKVIHDDRYGGQMDFDFDTPHTSIGLYGSHSTIRRFEIYAKSGVALDDQGSSIGLILSAFQHNMDSFWGVKNYAGDESSFYANLTLNKLIAEHTISTGLSYKHENRLETYLLEDYDTSERVPGVFGEYTYQPSTKVTAMLGLRYDHHNRFGDLITPRAHVNFRPVEQTTIRLSAGKGYRTPYLFMDNPAILASSKELNILEDIRAEEAWNAGVQFVQGFTIGADKPATLVLEFFRTEFQSQLIMDMEQDARHIYVYNLDGRSYSNAAQAEVSAAVVRGFDVTLAGRFNDVKTTYMNELKSLPLSTPFKGLLVLSYATPENKWQLDVSTQFNSQTRLPNTSMNPVEYQLKTKSPRYALMFVQLKRKIGKWDIYGGIENLTDFRQDNPILAWDDPFSPYFDSSIIWGPTFGRRFYVGFRFN